MSLAEIETAVERLSVAEQQELLRHLEDMLRHKRHEGVPESRDDWMRRLHSLRSSISSGKLTLSAEQIMAELRDD